MVLVRLEIGQCSLTQGALALQDFVTRGNKMLLCAGEHHPGMMASRQTSDRDGDHGERRRLRRRRTVQMRSDAQHEAPVGEDPSLLHMFNDMWSVDLRTGEWTFEGGDCNVNDVKNATRGVRGTPALRNTPQGRCVQTDMLSGGQDCEDCFGLCMHTLRVLVRACMCDARGNTAVCEAVTRAGRG